MEEEKIFRNYLLAPLRRREYKERIRWTRGMNCIFCSVLEDLNKKKLPQVINNVPTIAKFDHSFLIVNSFPYVPRGHLMLVTRRHITDIDQMNTEEIDEIFKKMIPKVKSILKKTYAGVKGFNVGFSIGKAAGASINHLHIHIVPRFLHDNAFMEATAGTKVVDEAPKTTMKRIYKYFK